LVFGGGFIFGKKLGVEVLKGVTVFSVTERPLRFLEEGLRFGFVCSTARLTVATSIATTLARSSIAASLALRIPGGASLRRTTAVALR
jgi:hypothetical protein